MPQPYSFPPSPSDGAALGASALLAKFDSDPAKRESIPHHTENALFIYQVIRKRYEFILDATEDFWQQLWVALLFHDAGKFVLNFQSENKKAQEANKKRTSWDTHIRHEFISCLLFMYDYEKLFGKEPFAFLAVAAHHKPLDQELYSRDAEKTLEYEDEDLRAIVIYLADRLQRLGITWDLSPIAQGKLEKARTEKSLSNAYKLVRRQIDNHLNFHRGHHVQSWVPARHRYAEFLGLLHTCDWLASAHKFPDPPLHFTPDQLLSELKAKEDASGSGKLVAWRKFQEDSVLVGNVLAIAPTGSGKTEASLLWASQKEASSKLIYCLPTRVTSNAIFQRMRKFFPSDGGIDHVGVVHSGAKDYRILSEKDERAADNYLTDRSFFRNVTVCTIDQLLTTGFNLGHWHLKLLHLRKASIVIDEIHLYAPYTLGLIIATIQYLQKYCQCRFYVMTATMPDKLKSLLATTLGSEVSIVEDVEKLGQARNTWRIDSRNFKDGSLLEQIKQDIAAKKKVLVVRNTVDSCVETFEALVPAGQRLLPVNTLQQTAMCLHARFTQHDRLAKEAIVVSPNLSSSYLLVSTQVIEVSLDIDFDIMYTENAPIDSLVQRAGRVNRKGNKGDSTTIHVCQASENSMRMYGSQIEDLLDRTWRVLSPYNGARITEAHMTQLVNEVYHDYEVTEQPAYQDALRKYVEIQQSAGWLCDLNHSEQAEAAYTREGLDSFSIIPKSERDAHQLREKNPTEKSQYQIAVRKDQLKRLGTVEEDEKHPWFRYVDAEYNAVTGLKIPTWEEIKRKNDEAGQSPAIFN